MVAHGTQSVVLLRAGLRTCALPLMSVVETMRPLPVVPVADTPAPVRGLAVIRGQPTPVIDLNQLLGSSEALADGRFVLLRVGERRVAVAVDEVLGVRDVAAEQLAAVPPLLQAAEAIPATAIGVRDRQLLVLLEAGRIVPDDWWQLLADGKPTA
ncbi:MAG: chemotaxis protein CheW [Planctomycetia bacterium]|nr:chemotaxis protein CheW [Planctomycetia bacterium]